jgi:hypothetical protein
MRASIWVSGLILAVFMVWGTTTVWACKSAGANKHIGHVTTIDSGSKTFTIRDAETDDLMTFEVNDTVLGKLRVNDRVMVGYRDDHGKMIAVDVQS